MNLYKYYGHEKTHVNFPFHSMLVNRGKNVIVIKMEAIIMENKWSNYKDGDVFKEKEWPIYKDGDSC